jgi:hypothetical protein
MHLFVTAYFWITIRGDVLQLAPMKPPTYIVHGRIFCSMLEWHLWLSKSVRTAQILGNCMETYVHRRWKKKYLKQPDAIKKVIEACSSDNVNDFWAIVLSCKEPMGSFILQNRESKLQTKNDVNIYARISKDERRKKTPETHCTCENCNNVVDVRKQCPCGLVVYCSKECQVNHRSIHKKICSHQKKKSKVWIETKITQLRFITVS